MNVWHTVLHSELVYQLGLWKTLLTALRPRQKIDGWDAKK